MLRVTSDSRHEEEMKIGSKMASVLSNALVVLIIISFRFSVIFGDCNRYLSDCGLGQVCCSRHCVPGSDCLDQSCSMDSDCLVNEEVCCSGKCRSGYICSGLSCFKKSDCSVAESCCNSVCKDSDDCTGDFCHTSNDCSVGQNCCMNICTNYDCDNPTVAILIAVVGSLGGLFVVFISIYYCHRRARFGRPGTAEEGRQVATTDATTTQSANQQGYAYQPLALIS